jgi:hypothetical protein
MNTNETYDQRCQRLLRIRTTLQRRIRNDSERVRAIEQEVLFAEEKRRRSWSIKEIEQIAVQNEYHDSKFVRAHA